MKRRQLLAYNRKISGFLDRNVQYAKGASGTVIDNTIWTRQYLPTERKYNAFVTARRAEVDALLLPKRSDKKGQETIGQRRSRTNKVQEGGSMYAAGDILHDPYATFHRKPGFVKGNEALLKIIATMKERMTPEYKIAMVKKDRETIDKSLDAMGLQDLKENFASLTDDQFDILFNESSFAEYFFPRYIKMKSMMGQMEDDEIQDKREETLEDIEWIKSVMPAPIEADTGQTGNPNEIGLADLNTMAKPKGISRLGQLKD
jgi:hypothetical protein